MNLVVDDAVEVRLATKSEEEKRRNLGISPQKYVCSEGRELTLRLNRSNPSQRRQRISHPSRAMIISYNITQNQWANGASRFYLFGVQGFFCFLRLRTPKILQREGG